MKALQGSPDARLPSEARSGFIDEMVKIWAPSTWKSQYHDVREEGKPGAPPPPSARTNGMSETRLPGGDQDPEYTRMTLLFVYA